MTRYQKDTHSIRLSKATTRKLLLIRVVGNYQSVNAVIDELLEKNEVARDILEVNGLRG